MAPKNVMLAFRIHLLVSLVVAVFAVAFSAKGGDHQGYYADVNDDDPYLVFDDELASKSSLFRAGRALLVNVTGVNLTSWLGYKSNKTLSYLADASRTSERVIGSVLVASSVALALLAVALALFAGLAPIGGSSGARRKRSLDDEDEQGSFSAGESVIRLVELAKEMYDGYDVRSVDCHRRLMCQLSKTEAYRRVGADKAFKFASLVENWVDLPPPVRILVDQLKFAVSFAKSADGLLDGGDGDGAAGAAGTRQSRRVPYYVTGDAAVSENGVPSTGGGGDGGGHDSCDVAFPDCDFSFYQFVRERLFRHRK